MKKTDKLFDNVDFDTAKKIAEEYPSLSENDMDRIFSRTMKKIELPSHDTESVKVYGVEHYKKPNLSRLAVLAASTLIAAAGIGGIGYMLHRINTSPPEIILPAVEPATQPVTEITENMTEQEKAAYRITDEYFTLGRYVYAGGFGFEDNNGLPEIDNGIELEYSAETKTDTQVYYPVVDVKFPDMDVLKEYYYSYRTENYTVYAEEIVLEDVLFGGDITQADIASPDTLGKLLYDENGRFYEFINIDSRLYMLQYPVVEGIERLSAMHWIDEPVISDVTEKSFAATRNYISIEETVMTQVTVTFEIIWDETAQDWRAASETISIEPIELE